ncbi:MAG TPA: tRNA uridine-5-carboxymethylaminomethyl(34) synthesis GTPase MnmE [Syntrophales bacterium]|nr:tRNA uridine-5-carboxymethylaminomethyl(34) synthesis GTPase MnmE [Syntrophales bacterium]HRT26818.1 tRNA uridine-5-carboxymethylaminomethyl(34) synthesis GTPase MnmE [Syntrophales bacterium]HRT70220.1 tRNA uridine-5-carboxymethylaminomethyl(34) synthesis GTPase MnmE [Syntrophales bacterium]
MAAVATPPGAGGIGVIRVSGPKAEEVGRLLFRPGKRPCPFATHHFYHGDVLARESGAVLDEALVVLMRAPHSYTGEDTLEIHCHGSPAVLRAVLEEVLKAGARPAEPGEFTRRAFLNGRMDLSQAEAVADLVAARAAKAREVAIAQLKGGLAEKVKEMRAVLEEQLAMLEAAVDFPEENIETEPPSEAAGKIGAVAAEIARLLATYDEGRLYREGIHVVIAGRPNVGKSSLLNRLLGEERAIVTPIPGTTRDFIEEEIQVGGVAVRLADTAGIREAGDVIEEEGIGRVWERVARADAVVFLLDGSEGLSSDDIRILEGLKGKKVIVAVNKSDLPQRLGRADVEGVFPGPRPLMISAKFGSGIEDLKKRILETVLDGEEMGRGEEVLCNVRHKDAFERTAEFLAQAGESLASGLSPEFAAQDIRDALRCLGEITGETTSEDILDRIFASFCVGK